MITNGLRFRVGVSLLLGLIWTSAALGDGSLFPGAQYAAGDGPASAAIGDLNGDQVSDLAVANRGSFQTFDGKLSVLLGVGDGTFAAAVYYATVSGRCPSYGRSLAGVSVYRVGVNRNGFRRWNEQVRVGLLQRIRDGHDA